MGMLQHPSLFELVTGYSIGQLHPPCGQVFDRLILEAPKSLFPRFAIIGCMHHSISRFYETSSLGCTTSLSTVSYWYVIRQKRDMYVHPQQNSRAEFSMNLQHLVTSANFALMHFLIPYHCVVEYIQQYQNSKNNYKKKKKTHLFGSNKLRKVNT